jgi:hypothetical protein
MSELIQTLVSIKDPFTLFAFVVVVLLIAFKTKSVPESIFELVNAKITRPRFYQLLNRSTRSRRRPRMALLQAVGSGKARHSASSCGPEVWPQPRPKSGCTGLTEGTVEATPRTVKAASRRRSYTRPKRPSVRTSP